MKNSFFKKLISLAAACVMALSVIPAATGAAIYDDDIQYNVNVRQPNRAYVYASVPRAYEGDLIDLSVTTDEGMMVNTIDICWYESGLTRHTYLYEEDMDEKVSDREGIWTFEMPASNVDISITLEKDWREFSVDVKIPTKGITHGEIFSTRYFPYYGDDIIFTAVPDYGYTVEYVKVNGKALTPVKENYGGETEFRYTVNDSRIDVTASFIKMDSSTYAITTNAMTGGTAYLNATAAKAGDRVTLTVTPNQGMEIDTVKYGSTVLTGKDGVYTFTMPPQKVNLSVTFKSKGASSSSNSNSGTSSKPGTSVSPGSSNSSAPAWVKVGNFWRIKNTNGQYITGWYKMNGQWYYMDAAGDMMTGWQLIGNWYFLKSSGAMATGWQLIDGTWYYLNAGGAMKTGWLQLGNNWYFLRSNGMMATGWNWINGKCYFFHSDGKMAANTTVNGYKLNASGVWVK